MKTSPFNVSDVLNRYFHDTFNELLGDYIYPEPNKDITVLLLRDETVDQKLNGNWPADYRFHAEVLEEVLRHKPQAIFLDFLLLSDSHSVESYREHFLEVLQDYKDANIPVYVPYSEGVARNWPEFGSPNNGLIKYVSANIAVDSADFITREYPITDCAKANMATKCQSSDLLYTAAVQIKSDLDPNFKASPKIIKQKPIDIFWGTSQNPNLNSSVNINKEEIAKDNFFYSGINLYINGFGDASFQKVFQDTLFVRDLFFSEAEGSTENDKYLNSLLTNKIVMYGANLSGIKDIIYTPIRTIVPGIYYHAMALDNLLKWDAGYKFIGSPNFATNSLIKWTWDLLPVLFIIFPFILIRLVTTKTLYKLNKKSTNLFERFLIRILSFTNTQINNFKKISEKNNFMPAIAKISLTLAIISPFFLWSLINFMYFNVSTIVMGDYLQFLGASFFLEKVNTIDYIENKFKILIKFICKWR